MSNAIYLDSDIPPGKWMEECYKETGVTVMLVDTDVRNLQCIYTGFYNNSELEIVKRFLEKQK
jgi:hypothetical protein